MCVCVRVSMYLCVNECGGRGECWLPSPYFIVLFDSFIVSTIYYLHPALPAPPSLQSCPLPLDFIPSSLSLLLWRSFSLDVELLSLARLTDQGALSTCLPVSPELGLQMGTSCFYMSAGGLDLGGALLTLCVSSAPDINIFKRKNENKCLHNGWYHFLHVSKASLYITFQWKSIIGTFLS